MPARARTSWRPTADGQYVRQIGWTESRTGKRTQAKFRLGASRKEAVRRDLLIRQLWDQLEAQQLAQWTPETLAAAKAIAAGERGVMSVTRRSEERSTEYAVRVAELAELHPGVQRGTGRPGSLPSGPRDVGRQRG